MGKKAEDAYNFIVKNKGTSIFGKILSLGTRVGLYNIDALITIPKDMKLELAKIIFDEIGTKETDNETKVRTNTNPE